MSFFGYYYAHTSELPPIKPTHLLEYWTASNGLFLRGEREGIKACIPIATFSLPIKGLARLSPRVDLDYPVVSSDQVVDMLAQSILAHNGSARPTEKLFHLRWRGQGWNVTVPDQQGTRTEVRPTQPYDTELPPPLIELHSHHFMEPFFSTTDNDDEQRGFRINAVWGHIYSHPTILVRLSLYGYYYPLRATQVFDLPPIITDGQFPCSANESAHGEMEDGYDA
jgi:hypothetical protein